MRRRLTFLLRTQQFKIDLTDALQRVFELVIIAQPLLDDGLLFGAEAELLGAPTRIADRQNPDRVARSAGANGAAGAMANNATEQRATDDLGGERKGRGEFGTLAEEGLLIHLYR
jgi:hypothetical protein